MLKELKYGTAEGEEFLKKEYIVVSVTQKNNVISERIELNTGEIAIITHAPLSKSIFTDYLYLD